jgi:hypothetical protein
VWKGNEVMTDTIKDYMGRHVRLTEERLKHISEHAEMVSLMVLVKETVTRPELVIESLSDRSALLYYRLLRFIPFGVKWLCVVVKYREDDAFVLTAYLTERPKKGNQLWPST